MSVLGFNLRNFKTVLLNLLELTSVIKSLALQDNIKKKKTYL